jgi:segregation and condensation protein B
VLALFRDRGRAYSPGMESRSESSDPRIEPLGLEGFVEPDDAGVSLDELSQAYAALLKKGNDPYPESQPETQATGSEPSEAPPGLDEPEAETRPDDAFEITPRSIVEAILFVGHPTGEPLTTERMASLMRGVRPEEIDELVAELNAEYAGEGAPYQISSVGPGYQMGLRPEFAAFQDAFYGRVREARLSQTAIDVLAIVAYHQPIAADDIDRLRGKPSGAILSQLLRRDLLSLERSAGKKGKAKYRTTSRFLTLFGLEGLSELPRSQDVEREL